MIGLGPHIQGFTPGTADYVAGCNAPILKTMSNSLESLRYVLERSPRTKTVVFRKYYHPSEQQAWLDSGNGGDLADAVYTEYERCHLECDARGLATYFEDLNEMPWDSWTSAPDKQARLSAAFARRCGGLGIRPAVLSIAVGNPPGSFAERAWIWEKLFPALDAALAAGGVLSRHLYGAPRMWEPNPRYYALRYRDDRAMWPTRLQALREIISECGIDYGVLRGSPTPEGYRTSGSAEQYVEDLEWFRSEIVKDPYIIGGVAFTVGNTDMWHGFDYTHESAVQNWMRHQPEEAHMPKPTSIAPVNRPVGAPGDLVTFTFLASGIDGWADGYAGLEFPLVPGTEQTYYGPGSQHNLPKFQDGTVDVEITIPEATTPLPPEGAQGDIYIQIVELDGTPVDPTIDGGRFGPFPIDLGGELEEVPEDEDDDAAIKSHLDSLWALAAAFGINGDLTNEAFIKKHVVGIKEAAGL